MNSWLACQEFELGAVEYKPRRGGSCMLNSFYLHFETHDRLIVGRVRHLHALGVHDMPTTQHYLCEKWLKRYASPCRKGHENRVILDEFNSLVNCRGINGS
ncbi:hypothetical protein TNCV_2013691 [Trichonephila clavipes]|nr:hypothetical protein TNCV_2013691 [Trichonephila clavipes]